MNKLISYIFLFLSFGLFAQSPISSSVDSTAIRIGSAFTFTIEAQGDKSSQVIFPETEQIGDFEVLEAFPTDTLLQEEKVAYHKKYLLTQFDTGSYNISRQSVFIDGKNYQTDWHKIDVLGVEVDTLKQPMYDIKTVTGSSVNTSNLPYYIAAIVLCLLIGLLVFWLIKRKQRESLTNDDLYKTPLEKVIKELHILDEKKWLINGNVKEYYSELTDIIREYIEELFEIPAKESTSTELIQHLIRVMKEKKVLISREMMDKLNQVLRNADLAKFAKMEPIDSEIQTDRQVAEQFSSSLDQAVEHFDEERSERIKLREQRFKKRKQIRTWVPIGTTLGLLLIVGGVYAYSSTSDKNIWAIFMSNKKLYQQEWVSSTYGRPAVIVQTPEALMRTQTASTKTESMQSPMAEFTYVNKNTRLLMAVKTTLMQAEQQTDLDQIVNQKIKMLENEFAAQDLQVDKSKITIQGTNGLHAKGSFHGQLGDDFPLGNYQFEWLIFTNQNGVIELAVTFEKANEYGQKIADKFIESVQLNPNKE